MSPFARRLLTGSLGLLLVLVIVLTTGGVFTARRSFPKVDGETRCSSWRLWMFETSLVPIYTGTMTILCQGYVRRTASGRWISGAILAQALSECLAILSWIQTSSRTLGWARGATRANTLDQQTWQSWTPTQGVNRLGPSRQPAQPEYAISNCQLRLSGRTLASLAQSHLGWPRPGTAATWTRSRAGHLA
jgi:hypothetical protein